MPSTKEYLRKMSKRKIRNICCLSAEASISKQKLIDWLEYKPYKLPDENKNEYKFDPTSLKDFPDLAQK